jgi:hypothetical protein
MAAPLNAPLNQSISPGFRRNHCADFPRFIWAQRVGAAHRFWATCDRRRSCPSWASGPRRADLLSVEDEDCRVFPGRNFHVCDPLMLRVGALHPFASVPSRLRRSQAGPAGWCVGRKCADRVGPVRTRRASIVRPRARRLRRDRSYAAILPRVRHPKRSFLGAIERPVIVAPTQRRVIDGAYNDRRL